MVVDKKKISAWMLPSLRWYGVSKDEISTIPDVDFPWETVIQITSENLYQQYLTKVMNL